MKIKVLFLISTTFLVSSCVTPSVKEYTAPGGRNVKTVKCNQTSQKCFETATSSCPEVTYQVVSSESHAGGLLADVIPGPVTWYGMSYICGPSDGKMPEFAFQGQEYTPPPPKPEPIQVEIKNQPTTTSCYESGNTIDCTTH